MKNLIKFELRKILTKRLTTYSVCCILQVSGGKPTDKSKAGGKDMDQMTNAQWDAILETIAKRIESEAITPEDAARIVREAKTSQ